MENQPTDLLDQFEEREIVYASFWERFFALIIDGIVFSPLAIIKTFIDSDWGNQVFIIFTALLGLVYKPLMEYKYGATLGKMALKIVVVNKQYQQASISNALLRNIFEIGEHLLSLIPAILSFGSSQLYNTSPLGGFKNLQYGLNIYSWISLLPALITIIDLIFLLSDDRRRSLHDRIGETFVIKK